ncbi:MAG: hypothetical protein GY805_12010 [Chloroflexi bacterium]|nr:hypothetical protein [Chloroflexota bacterium]
MTAEQDVDEDFEPVQIDLNDYFADPDGDLLIYSVTVNNTDEVVKEILPTATPGSTTQHRGVVFGVI